MTTFRPEMQILSMWRAVLRMSGYGLFARQMVKVYPGPAVQKVCHEEKFEMHGEPTGAKTEGNFHAKLSTSFTLVMISKGGVCSGRVGKPSDIERHDF